MIEAPTPKTTAHWAKQYIGLSYVDGGRTREGGVDCWGLLRLVYLEQKGIELPLLPGVADCGLSALTKEIDARVAQDWKQIMVPRDMCGVTMGTIEHPYHVGVWTQADGGLVIHTFKNGPVVAEKLRSLQRRGVRAIKFYECLRN